MSYRLGATAGLGARAPLFVFLDTRVASPLRVGSHGAARSPRWNTSMNCHAEPLSLSPMATAKKKCSARTITDIAVGFAYRHLARCLHTVQISVYMRFMQNLLHVISPTYLFSDKVCDTSIIHYFSKKMKYLRIESFFLCIFATTNDLLQY